MTQIIFVMSQFNRHMLLVSSIQSPGIPTLIKAGQESQIMIYASHLG